MPTNNPKVSAYLPQHVFNQLKVFAEEHKLSMSQAATVVFANYFGIDYSVNQSSLPTDGLTIARVEALEQKVSIYCDSNIASSANSELLGRLRQLTEYIQQIDSRLKAVEDKSSGKEKHKPLKSNANLSQQDEGAPLQLSLDEKPVQLSESTQNLELKTAVDQGQVSSLPTELPSSLNTENVELHSGVTPTELLSELLFKPLPAKVVAKRLGYHPDSLTKIKREKTEEDFAELSIKKDPDNIAWKFIQEGRGYLPAIELSSELQSKLLKWIKKNFPDYSS